MNSQQSNGYIHWIVTLANARREHTKYYMPSDERSKV